MPDLRLVSLFCLLAIGVSLTPAAVQADTAASFVGSDQCQGCHRSEYDAWQGSHHQLAMQPATDATVLGDFNSAEFKYHGVTSRFYVRDGRFFVFTDGADGKMAEFEITHTFGVDPLQQYLVELPGGRLQALSIAWDSRPAVRGGQRWLHLYPDDAIGPGDELHWSGLQMNWNYMCADCHSTNLEKNYQPDASRFNTTWSEIHVGCEACHGPGSNHLKWAGQAEAERDAEPAKGLSILLTERQGVYWTSDHESGAPKRSTPNTQRSDQVRSDHPIRELLVLNFAKTFIY